MNAQIRRLGIGLLACYIALFVMLNWIQFFHKDQLDNNSLNTIQVKADFNKPRGTITSADGALLAQSVDVPDGGQFKRQRTYPEGDLFGQLTGYYSFDFGSTGLESSYNDELAGQTIGQQLHGFADLLNPRPQVGNLTITVRKDLQQVAKDALGDREGSVVAIDPKTGAILAFWSFPSNDPNLLSNNDQQAAKAARALLTVAPGQPLRSRWSRARPACRPAPSPSTRRRTPWRRATPRPGRPSRSATSAGSRAAARWSRSCGSRATRRSPRWAPRPSVPTR